MSDIFTVSFSGVVMAFCALALGFFSLWRYRHYKANPANSVNYYYWTASALVTFGFTLYLIPGFIEVSRISDTVIILAIAATVINVTGFGYFFLIPIYSWLSKEMFVLGSHIIGFCVFGIAAMLAICFGLFGTILLTRNESGEAQVINIVDKTLSPVMNMPIGALAYYRHFAGQVVQTQFSSISATTLPSMQFSLSDSVLYFYRSPLFQDTGFWDQHYALLQEKEEQ